MRIRTVKPEWLSDELLAAASDEARLLSVGLILMADDEGRGRGSIPTIVAEVWRFEAARDDGANAREVYAKARRALAELSSIGWVVLYEVSGQSYFWVRNFNKHQKIDKPTKSKIPTPCEDSPSLRRGLCEDSDSPLRTVSDGSTTDQDQDQGSGSRESRDLDLEERSLSRAQTLDPDTERLAVALTTRPYVALVEPIRAAVVSWASRRRVACPSDAQPGRERDALLPIARWLHETAEAQGWPPEERPAKATWLVERFYGTRDPRTIKAGYPLKFLAQNPQQYALKETAA